MIWIVAFVAGFMAGWWTCNRVFTKKARKLSRELVSHLAECDRLHAEMDDQLEGLRGR